MKKKIQVGLLISSVAFIVFGVYRSEVNLILKKAIKL